MNRIIHCEINSHDQLQQRDRTHVMTSHDEIEDHMTLASRHYESFNCLNFMTRCYELS